MERYVFYSRNDETMESINSGCFRTKEEATEYWSKIKRLKIDQFVELYEVRKIKGKCSEGNN